MSLYGNNDLISNVGLNTASDDSLIKDSGNGFMGARKLLLKLFEAARMLGIK